MGWPITCLNICGRRIGLGSQIGGFIRALDEGLARDYNTDTQLLRPGEINSENHRRSYEVCSPTEKQ